MALSWNEIRLRAQVFSDEWSAKAQEAREAADAQTFETDFFRVFGISRKQAAVFEKKVKIGGDVNLFGEKSGGAFGKNALGYIDCFWKGHIIIEMKSPGEDLEEAYKQALRYTENLSQDDIPKGILICDFKTFEHYNLDKGEEKTSFKIEEFPKFVEGFGYLADYE